MKISIYKAISAEDIQKCLDIRTKVFVDGQNVSMHEEIDGKDEGSDHYLLMIDESPAGVARVRFIENYAKIERVAVLEEYQGKGFGKLIMEMILSEIKDNASVQIAKLSAQLYAIPFYEKLGFKVCSGEYTDAGIMHKDMQLNL